MAEALRHGQVSALGQSEAVLIMVDPD